MLHYLDYRVTLYKNHLCKRFHEIEFPLVVVRGN